MKKFKFESIEVFLGCLAMVVMFFSIGINIVLNWVAGLKFGQLEELGTAAYMFACYVVIGWLYRKNDLTCVSFAVDKLGPKSRWFADLIYYAYILFFGIIMTYNAILLCGNSMIKTLPALRIPYAYVDVCMVIGFALLSMRAGIDLVKHFGAIKKVFKKEVNS